MQSKGFVIFSNIFTASIFGTIPSFIFSSRGKFNIVTGYVTSVEMQVYYVSLFIIGLTAKLIHGFMIRRNYEETEIPFFVYNQLIVGTLAASLIMGGVALGLIPAAISNEHYRLAILCLVIAIVFLIFSIYLDLRVVKRKTIITKHELIIFSFDYEYSRIKIRNSIRNFYQKHLKK
nr:hypothetical protein [uncultured Desulfuromonas sp.]